MDIAFTIGVWILLVSLTVYGLRLTQRAGADRASALEGRPSG